MNNIERLKQMEQLEKNTNESLRNSLKITYQTIDIGNNIMMELDKQSNQISSVENDVDQISENNKKASYHLRSIKSIFGTVVNKVLGYQYININAHAPIPVPVPTPTNNGSTTISNTNISVDTTKPTITKLITHSTDQTTYHTTHNDDVDKQLDELHDAMSHIYNMGVGMGLEIDSQNKRLSKLAVNVDKQELHIQKNNIDIQELLNTN